MNGNDFNNNNPFENESDDYLYKFLNAKGRRKTYSWSLASMICGILACVLCCFGYTAVIFGILALVFAIISRKNLGFFDGMAVAGLVLGIIGLVLGVVLLIAVYTIDEELLRELEDYLNQLQEQETEQSPDL